jgi:DNA-directed RNA polymerase subunit RPC12/RpoP
MEMETMEETQMSQFDYHCNWCEHEFFIEEGYEMEIDDIICPYCGCKRCNSDYFIKEL